MGMITGAYSQVRTYAHKYPWFFYYIIISTLSSFVLAVYRDSITISGGISALEILRKFLIEGIAFVFLLLIITLMVKYVFDKYFTVGDNGYVYFPVWFFIIGLFFYPFSIFLSYQNASTAIFGNIGSVYFSQFIQQIFLLLVTIVLFILYRKPHKT